MSPRDLLGFAGDALLQNRRRSALSLLGVVIGVVAVVTLTAIGEGALRYVTTQFASLGSSLVNVSPGKNETSGGMPHGIGGVPNDLTIQDAIVLERRIPSVRTAMPVSTTHIAVGAVFGVGFFREYYTRRSKRRRDMIAGTNADKADDATPVAPEILRHRKLVRRSHFLTIIAAWVITVPATALLSAAVFFVLSAVV